MFPTTAQKIMPKNLSGQKEQTPMRLDWATFCRQVVVDASNSQDPSLIGVLRGLNLNVESPIPQESVEIPFVIWVHASFQFLEKTKADRKFVLSVRMQAANRDPLVKKLEIIQKPDSDFGSANIQLLMNTKENGFLNVRSGKNAIKLSFRYQGVDLGTVELPIQATFNVSNVSEEKSE